MNILIEGGDLNPPFIEGTRNIVRTYIKELSKRHTVIILTRRKETITEKKLKKEDFVEGIRYYRWDSFLDLFFLLPKIVKKEKIELIHIFAKGLRPNFYFSFLKKRINKPIVYTLLGFPNFAKDYKNNLSKVISKIGYFTISSETLFNEVKDIDEKKIRFIPYGVDTEKFNSLKNKNKKKRIMLCLKIPNIPLLKAFQGINKEFENTWLFLDADPLKKKGFGADENIINFIKKEKIKNVHFIENINNMNKLLADTEILIEPHPKDRYLDCASPPLLLLEAMASEVKTVSTDIPEIKEVIEDGKNGFLIKENDEENFYLGIKRALKERKPTGKNARNTILERYNIKKIVPKFEEIYQRLVDN